MKFGLQISSFTWPGGPAQIAPTLARVVRAADDAGFDSIWVMDHFFQIRMVGRPEEPMLDGMTALGWIAAHTERARIGLMVGGVHYRQPGLWIKATTTLDVLSGGRAWFGVGAAWNQEESQALGFAFPPLGIRFQMLEDTLRMAHAMWSGERGSGEDFQGRHVHATRLLNSPQALSQPRSPGRPRIPIMIGGGGERKTLRLVAQYGDACNVFGGPERIHHKFEVLRRHCEDLRRPFDEIERTTLQGVHVDPSGADGAETPAQVTDRFAELGDAGAQHVLFSVRDVWRTDKLELLGRTLLTDLRAR